MLRRYLWFFWICDFYQIWDECWTQAELYVSGIKPYSEALAQRHQEAHLFHQAPVGRGIVRANTDTEQGWLHLTCGYPCALSQDKVMVTCESTILLQTPWCQFLSASV